MNKYLSDRAERRERYNDRRDRRNGRNDYREHVSGYYRDSRTDYARGYDNGYESGYDKAYSDRRNHERDYNRDYNRDYGDDEEKYKKDIKKLTDKLKKKDRFGLSKNEVINYAQKMDARFDDYNEEEFYLVYLMVVSDYPGISNDPNAYIAMAKQWLEDDDVMRRGSDKLCAYICEIVLADD